MLPQSWEGHMFLYEASIFHCPYCDQGTQHLNTTCLTNGECSHDTSPFLNRLPFFSQTNCFSKRLKSDEELRLYVIGVDPLRLFTPWQHFDFFSQVQYHPWEWVFSICIASYPEWVFSSFTDLKVRAVGQHWEPSGGLAGWFCPRSRENRAVTLCQREL